MTAPDPLAADGPLTVDNTPGFEVQLVMDQAKQTGVLPVFDFKITRWDSADTKKTVAGAKLTFYECEYDPPHPPQDSPPTKSRPIAIVTVNFRKNGAAWAASAAHVDAKVAGPTDFYVAIEGIKDAVALAVPRVKGILHDAGATFEIGLVLEAGADRVGILGSQKTALTTVPADTSVLRMRSLKGRAYGAYRASGMTDLGRFDDPKRVPSVAPAEAATFDDKVLAELKKGSGAVDMDGLTFSNFVAPEKRRETIQALADELTAKIYFGTPKPKDALDKVLKVTDIEKAYFVLHDADAGTGLIRSKAATLSDRFDPKTGGEPSVNGYVNRDGTLALFYDLDDAWKGGTVYEWMRTGTWIQHTVMGFETLPLKATDDVLDDKEDKGKTFACAAWDATSKIRWKWPHRLLDTLALLYVLASARANHLLTIATHVEMDRNLGFSNAFWWETEDGAKANPTHEQLAAYLQSALGRTFKLALGPWLVEHPSDGHDDPVGLDLQVLYDKISDRLGKLGGLSLRAGLRYGTNPDRQFYPQTGRADRAKSPGGLRHRYGNSDGDMLTFPHQSSGTIAMISAADHAARIATDEQIDAVDAGYIQRKKDAAEKKKAAAEAAAAKKKADAEAAAVKKAGAANPPK